MKIDLHKGGIHPKRLDDKEIGLTLYTPEPLALEHGIHEVYLKFDISFDETEFAMILSKKKMAGNGVFVLNTGLDRRSFENFSILLEVKNESFICSRGTAIATLVILQNAFLTNGTWH